MNQRMDRASPDPSRPALAERFEKAGIPVPPPMSDQERAGWERRKAEASAYAEQFWAERNSRPAT
jgi:hypothetical protein